MQIDPITSRVLARAHIIRVLRHVVNPFTLELAAFLVFFGLTYFMVSIPSIVSNFMSMHSVSEYGMYMASSFINTQLIVKVLSLGIVVAGFFVFKKIFINTPYSVYRHYRPYSSRSTA